MLLIKSFDLDELLPQKKKYYRSPYSRSIRANTESFFAWVVKVLDEVIRVVPKGKRLNSQALYFNKKNLDELSKHVGAFDYLNYSPKENNSLKDNEFGIELSEITIQDN